MIIEKQERRAKERYSKLVHQKEIAKQENLINRPLGPRQKILETDRIEFSKIVDDITGNKMEELTKSLKPNQWRDFMVRLICTTRGENGEELKRLWIKLYRGDLMHGIRDERWKAKKSNWPLRSHNPGRRDRNSWIAYGLRKSCLTANKSGHLNKK